MLAPLVLIAAACGGSGASEGSGSSSSVDVSSFEASVEQYEATPTEILQSEPLKKAPPKGKSVIFVSNGLPGTVKIGQGVEAAANAVGWDFSTVTFDAADPATLQAAFMSALQKDPDFVVQSGTPQSEFGASVIDAYEKAGVPIILTSVYPFEPTDVILGDPNGPEMQKQSGEMLADWFIADSKGQGNVLIENVSAYPVLGVAVDAFKKRVDSECPDCTTETIEITAAQVASGDLVPAVVAELRTMPDTGYLFFDNAQFAAGIGPALQAAGRDDVEVFGRSIEPNAAAGLTDGSTSAWTGTSFFYTGYMAIDIAARHLEGEEIDPTKYDQQPTQLITADNVDTYEGEWHAPQDSLEQFTKLWHVDAPECTVTC